MRGLPARLLLFANLLAALCAALFFVALYVAPASFTQSDPALAPEVSWQVRGNPILGVTALVALVLLVADVLWLLYGRQPREPLRHVTSDGQGGPLKVSREAIETALRQAGEALDDVTRLRVSVQHGGLKKILLHAQFQAPEGVSIQAVSGRLREALQRQFAAMVRLTEGARMGIEVEFLGFAGRRSKRSEEEPVPAPPEEAPTFTGPQYPIDDEGEPWERTPS